MAFPDARRPQEDGIFLLLDEGEFKKIHHRAFIQLRVEREIVFIDGLLKGKPGDFERSLQPAVFLDCYLLGEKLIQEAQIGQFILLGTVDRKSTRLNSSHSSISY